MIEIVMEVDDEFWNIINQLKEFKGQKEIIHCKDCKYWEQSFGYNCKEYWDCKLGLKDTDADDFCSRGVRR